MIDLARLKLFTPAHLTSLPPLATSRAPPPLATFQGQLSTKLVHAGRAMHGIRMAAEPIDEGATVMYSDLTTPYEWDETESKVEFMRFFHLALRLSPPHEGKDEEDGSVAIIAKFWEARGFEPSAQVTLEDFWSVLESKWIKSEAQQEAQSFIR